ncbi:hypothetical protein BYT27DRAFT_6865084 [Phlegmacium glaucopus]|nr:hypothetical protein BYT27DRAFT_6865084 [Phlegmacium glaucopus]
MGCYRQNLLMAIICSLSNLFSPCQMILCGSTTSYTNSRTGLKTIDNLEISTEGSCTSILTTSMHCFQFRSTSQITVKIWNSQKFTLCM